MSNKETPQKPRSEIAYRQLLEAIKYGKLKPGTRIREVALAEQFGISRTPVREAIRRLESDGLLIHLPRQGAVIRQLDPREVIELYEIRETLEGTVARYAARHVSEMEISDLEDLNELMRARAADDKSVANANKMFHAALYRSANNRFLIDALGTLSNSMALLGGTTLRVANRTRTAYYEHKAMIDAMKDRDADKAEAAARLHIRNAQRLRLRLIHESGGF